MQFPETLQAGTYDYLDYCNNRRVKIKLKGLPPALRRQQTLSVS
ncbi:MAG: IS3 family transposase [Acutalibacteraceae bacterium]